MDDSAGSGTASSSTLPAERIRLTAQVTITIVPPFDHDWIIAGQGSLGLEILEQLPGVRSVSIHYRSVARKIVVETLFFDDDRRAIRASAAYGENA